MKELKSLELDLTQQESIPQSGIDSAVRLMKSGKLHRYGEVGAKPSEVSLLEQEFANSLKARYCIAMNSCGSTMFVALRAAGVKPGDLVLSNCFTLAPVPGAIAHVGARPVLVDVTEDLTIDLEDLARKASSSQARFLLLSHMRGHICDMQALIEICRTHGITVIEDCAHTMGAAWAGRPTGTWGVAGCFSLQSYKHANGGEGGLLVTDNDDIAAQAILLSGSYMLYSSHLVRPPDAVFERWKYLTPNFSLRMGNLVAAIVRPQLGESLNDRCFRWNERYCWLEKELRDLANIQLPRRPANEQYVASSIQFLLKDLSVDQVGRFIRESARLGLHIKWFGADQPQGFTSVWSHWRFFADAQQLPRAEAILKMLCDIRIPLSLTQQDCVAIGAVIRHSLQVAQ